ncbi:hypothetical protein GSI_03592 [Ganoderma sinense ZZ0214-1]|uniref:Uncharacterized protein n=1 Tax=Ganoderma sinense ZZ0214-1 TaxID=1077348 RepID=A0A2G8SJD8_9APHY|nr:hypothetical protein GSI_03592 [Ganoderma sinense ZZ0214-1]
MWVINWKTGITAWAFNHQLWSRCRLISQSHVVVVAFESLIVYPIDPHLNTPPPHSTGHTALCILQLPAWSTISLSRSLLVESYIQFPPALGPNDRPLHRHDPDLTLLTLEIHYIVDVPEHEPEFVQYAMFIPISTLKTRVELTLAARAPRGALRPSSRGTSGARPARASCTSTPKGPASSPPWVAPVR